MYACARLTTPPTLALPRLLGHRTEVAHYLTELIDNAVRSELGRYKNSAR
jgi:hypothetical protein